MNKTNTNLQDLFLNQLRKEKIPVTVYLMNGVKLTGTIKGFDNFSILIKQDTQQLIYKHAVSTIIPHKAVSLMEREEERSQMEEVVKGGAQ
ncbi:MAG: RNA chaperone Hfq [Nitrospirae bacterium]|nr:RNA chaperone Hfq [Nitrospirota bacterium]